MLYIAVKVAVFYQQVIKLTQNYNFYDSLCQSMSGKVCNCISKMYRVGNKFSDTLNELFLVNWLISIFL